MNRQNFKKSNNLPFIQVAFTLAETLIVIGIIGVVAALTLPNLNHATGDKETVTRVMKIYSSLTDAVDRAQVIYGDADEWFNDIDDDRAACSKRLAERISEFLKISKTCGFSEGCFSSAPLLGMECSWNEDGNANYSTRTIFSDYLKELQQYGAYMFMLSDGSSLAFMSETESHYSLHIKVDIDGPNKGKNQMGVDIFSFSLGLRDSKPNIYKYLELIPDCGIYGDSAFPDGAHDDFGRNATAWVIENGNMDYLKCANELDWETHTSCN